MAYSDDFYRQIKKRSSAGKIAAESVRKLFFDFLDEIPEDLRWDIYNLFFPESDTPEELSEEDAIRLIDVIDLIEGEYEESEQKISDEELRYISEGVNDYALELSDDVLMNVMKAAVARGLMG